MFMITRYLEFLSDIFNVKPGTLEIDSNISVRSIFDTIDKALESLTPNEKEVLIRYYGLQGSQGFTIQVIAKNMKKEKLRVSQIYAKARAKMIHPKRELKAFLFSKS